MLFSTRRHFKLFLNSQYKVFCKIWFKIWLLLDTNEPRYGSIYYWTCNSINISYKYKKILSLFFHFIVQWNAYNAISYALMLFYLLSHDSESTGTNKLDIPYKSYWLLISDWELSIVVLKNLSFCSHITMAKLGNTSRWAEAMTYFTHSIISKKHITITSARERSIFVHLAIVGWDHKFAKFVVLNK